MGFYHNRIFLRIVMYVCMYRAITAILLITIAHDGPDCIEIVIARFDRSICVLPSKVTEVLWAAA